MRTDFDPKALERHLGDLIQKEVKGTSRSIIPEDHPLRGIHADLQNKLYQGEAFTKLPFVSKGLSALQNPAIKGAGDWLSNLIHASGNAAIPEMLNAQDPTRNPQAEAARREYYGY